MSRKQLPLLFVGSLVLWTIGNGVMPLMPVYAVKLGASQAATGNVLASAFLALAGGTFFSGWLADRLQRRKVLIIASGTALVPALWTMGQAGNLGVFAASFSAITFLWGVGVTLINVLAGLFAPGNERGRVFGILGLTVGLGNILGGLSVGPMVDRWGYRTMFSALALLAVLVPVVALFMQDKKTERAAARAAAEHGESPGLGRAFLQLLAAQLIVITVHGEGNIGRSLSMNGLGFAATALTSTGVIGGLVSLPFPFILGWLSDRLGRKRMMVICYASYGLTMVIYALSQSLWHFWIGSVFFSIGMISNSVGTAFVTDLVDSRVLGRGVSLFQGMFWLANVIGLAAAGYVFQSFGISPTLLASAALPAVGIILVLSIRVPERRVPAV
jgi:MFS family permease